MLSSELLEKIASGEIGSRRQLYKVTGRSISLRKWLDEKGLLMPNWATKESVTGRMLELQSELGRLPRAQDDWGNARAAQRVFGSWNNAMDMIFSEVTQKRYANLEDEELLGLVRKFAVKYQRLPLREEFDGKEWPYFEAYFTRFKVTRWADVVAICDLSGLRLYDQKHGYGKLHLYGGKVYLSHHEMLIGRYLTEAGIEFIQEVPYGGETAHRFDFFIPSRNIYIEYYGIQTDDYRARITEKRKLYGDREVLEIFKHDNTIDKLSRKVQRL